MGSPLAGAARLEGRALVIRAGVVMPRPYKEPRSWITSWLLLLSLLVAPAFALAPFQRTPAELVNLAARSPAALAAPIVTVTDKTVPPPSGDRHDYVSYARYWWPDPAQPEAWLHRQHEKLSPGFMDRLLTETAAHDP